MIVERAEFPIKPGQEAAFAAAMSARGRAILEAAEGCHSVVIGRGVESPDSFIFLLEWDTVASHTAFTTTPAFAELIGLIGPLIAGPTSMEHFEIF